MTNKEMIKERKEQIDSIKQDVYKCFSKNGVTLQAAVDFYNLGYRKFLKDSVVLSREEYKELKHYEDEMYRLQGVVDQLTNEGWDILDEKEDKIRKVERKEMAEKIITFLDDYCDCDSAYLVEQAKEYVTKQLGIKIKEF